MTAPRSTRQNYVYNRYRQNVKTRGCDFCSIGPKSDQLVREYLYFNVIKNIFPYSLWDNQKVADHLMIVPKKHTDTLADLNAAEAKEYVVLLAEYEKYHYNIYARAPSSVVKTIAHHHTHLIKPMGGFRKFIFLVRKPFYLRITF